MRTFFSICFCVAMSPLGVRLLNAAEPAIDVAEQKTLERFVGDWKNAYKIHQSDWTPKEKTGTSKVAARRILGGRYVQETSEDSDKTSSMRLLTYDADKKSFRAWWFSSEGHSLEHVGSWNGDAKTMTWKSVGKAPVTTVTGRFDDDDHMTWDVTVRDAAGKTVFQMDGTCVRAKTAAER
jgi:hypothetical protein